MSAFVAALRDHKEADLRAILGPEADRVIDSGDRYADQELHQRFVALYDEKHTIDQKAPGAPSWMSAPTTGRCRSRWSRTTGAGLSTPRQVRRRSSTVASAATSCRRSVRCSPASMRNTIISIVPSRQTAAASMPRAWSARPAVAMAFTGRSAEGETESPLGPLIDAAQDAGYPGELVGGKPIPYEGYYFRILKATRSQRGWRGQELRAVGPHDRRLRVDRLAGGVRVERHHDVHRRPGWRCVPEGPGTQDGAHRRGNDDVRPGPYMVTCRDDERLTRARLGLRRLRIPCLIWHQSTCEKLRAPEHSRAAYWMRLLRVGVAQPAVQLFSATFRICRRLERS